MINIRTFLLGFLALALIGGAGAGAMYYQSVMTERAEMKRIADEYYFNAFELKFRVLECFRKAPPGTTDIPIWDMEQDVEKEIEQVKEQMYKDGYSYAESGAMVNKARGKVNAPWAYNMLEWVNKQ